MIKIKNILLLLFILVTALSLAVFAQQEPPPYPTEYWIMGQLDGTAVGLSGSQLDGFTVISYNTSTTPWTAFAAGVSYDNGKFLINAMDDLRMLPLTARTCYIGVGRKQIGDKFYGKNETNLAISAADLGNGYKSGITLALAENEGVWVPGPLDIVTASLPDGAIGIPYSANLVATGGTPPFTWAIESGGLPPGLTLTPGTGLISGTPTQIGGFSFNISVADSAGGRLTRSLELLILPPPGPGPKIDITALLEGFRGRPVTLLVEAREGASPGAATTVAGTCLIPLRSNGAGTNNGTWQTYPTSGRSYYLVIRHKLGDFDGNHLPVITNDPKITLTDLVRTPIDISDSTSLDFKEVYTPTGLVPALKTLGPDAGPLAGKLAMRAGYLNGIDKIIDIGDYAVWKGAVTPAGTVDPAVENSVRSDVNGDNIIDVSDYSLWKGTVQDYTPGGNPQTVDHVYVP